MEETSMVTELIFVALIIALSALILWALLFRISEGSTRNAGEPPKEPIRGTMSWFKDCYEPCMGDPEQTSDSCVMMCAWNLL
jgi:hypothetical protein